MPNTTPITKDELRKEIAFAQAHRAGLNEYGDGHYNVIMKITSRTTLLHASQANRTELELLVLRAQEIIKQREELSYEVDKRAFPRLAEILEKTGEYDTLWVFSAMNEGLATPEELRDFAIKRKVLIKEEYKERFLHIGREIRAVHEQYILLLKDILKEA